MDWRSCKPLPQCCTPPTGSSRVLGWGCRRPGGSCSLDCRPPSCYWESWVATGQPEASSGEIWRYWESSVVYVHMYSIILYYIILYYSVLYYFILYYFTLYYIILYYIILVYVILYCIRLNYTILYYVTFISYYIMLSYVMLCYIILYLLTYDISMYIISMYYIIYFISITVDTLRPSDAQLHFGWWHGWAQMEAVIQTDEENHVRSIHLKDVIYSSKSYSYWLSDDHL